ncbi:MAG: aminoglycoside adenylyltransferase [Firmicutes bacterium HGW-Firmicutes-21]|nr:MAG: aminoglycoside adenylyltransferase [Firmicutes bacterium HGW-Firmicutes-21]
MRTEKEMFDLILGIAKADERVKAVLMVGSRANPNAPKDIYQDYDITYFVRDVSPFYNNLDWIEQNFGKPMIMQLPENMSHPLLAPEGDGHFIYLMIFEDGNRIDLSIEYTPYFDDGEPAIVLLDKDGFLPNIPIPTDKHWYIKPPTKELFSDCCNEFWWSLNNVGKGIARDELPYVMEMFNHYIRDMLNQMVDWYIGIKTNFSVSSGKMGKYYKRHLSSHLYDMYAKTYSDSDYDNLWAAVFTACELFRVIATSVAEHFSFTYNKDEEIGIMKYLNWVKVQQTSP